MAQDKTFQMRVDGEWLDMIDDWRMSGGHEISRADAVRYLVSMGLTAHEELMMSRKELVQPKRGEINQPELLLKKIRDNIFHGKPGYEDAAAMLVSLTKREHQILDLVSQGLSNIRIAEYLNIAEHTVKVHVHNIMKKLHVRDRGAATSLWQKYEEEGRELPDFLVRGDLDS